MYLYVPIKWIHSIKHWPGCLRVALKLTAKQNICKVDFRFEFCSLLKPLVNLHFDSVNIDDRFCCVCPRARGTCSVSMLCMQQNCLVVVLVPFKCRGVFRSISCACTTVNRNGLEHSCALIPSTRRLSDGFGHRPYFFVVACYAFVAGFYAVFLCCSRGYCA